MPPILYNSFINITSFFILYWQWLLQCHTGTRAIIKKCFNRLSFLLSKKIFLMYHVLLNVLPPCPCCTYLIFFFLLHCYLHCTVAGHTKEESLLESLGYRSILNSFFIVHSLSLCFHCHLLCHHYSLTSSDVLDLYPWDVCDMSWHDWVNV